MFALREGARTMRNRMAIACHGCRAAAGSVLIALTLLAPPDVAHGRLLRVIDDPRFEQAGEFGRTLAGVGSDLAVGAPGARVFDQDHAGLVRLLGTDGVLRRTFEARTPVANAAFGSTVVVSGGGLYRSAPGGRSTRGTRGRPG